MKSLFKRLSSIALASMMTFSISATVFAQTTSNTITTNANTVSTLKPWIPANMTGTISIENEGSVTIVSGKSATPPSTNVLPSSSSLNTIHSSTMSPNSDFYNLIWEFTTNLYRNWIGPYSVDHYGPHFNVHIQTIAKDYKDAANFHVRYQGIRNDQYTWTSYDSVSGETTAYEVDSAIYSKDGAAEVAAQKLAQFVGENWESSIEPALLSDAHGVGQSAGDLIDVFEELI